MRQTDRQRERRREREREKDRERERGREILLTYLHPPDVHHLCPLMT